MKVKTYLRTAKDGKSLIYVDYSVNGKRQRKKTGMFLYDRPKNIPEREHNKQTYVSQLTLKIQNNELGIKTPKHKIKDFVVYFEHLTQQRENTEKNYSTWKSALKHLKEFYSDGLKFSDLDINSLEQFSHYLTDVKKLKTSSANNYFNVVLHGVHDAFRDRMIDIDYAEYVKAPKIEQAVRVYLTEDEILKLENAHCKNLLLKKTFLFSCRTGMSFTDVKNLEWQHFKKDHDGNYFIAFHRKKTKGLQYHPITKEAKDLLGESGKPDEKIFKDLRYNSWMNIILKEWMFQADIKKPITFHCARHSYATLLLHKGADITEVKELLGHEDLKTTMRYAHVMDSDLRKAAELIKFNSNQTNG
ncbi:tyrosine-type recombinase/integrase [Moheibacter sediminis]|uniref:Site-specific recombinase XerD n=1 Tax=Moheibacter sediminis TaxID=1434700 RepID=A0A1W2B6Y7_9FLAO|nr:site-specific integrase [Moheibacter sediminis]SMC68118.1 Site-specific recombinase XerD [Moheibacter sediminis]